MCVLSGYNSTDSTSAYYVLRITHCDSRCNGFYIALVFFRILSYSFIFLSYSNASTVGNSRSLHRIGFFSVNSASTDSPLSALHRTASSCLHLSSKHFEIRLCTTPPRYLSHIKVEKSNWLALIRNTTRHLLRAKSDSLPCELATNL